MSENNIEWNDPAVINDSDGQPVTGVPGSYVVSVNTSLYIMIAWIDLQSTDIVYYLFNTVSHIANFGPLGPGSKYLSAIAGFFPSTKDQLNYLSAVVTTGHSNTPALYNLEEDSNNAWYSSNLRLSSEAGTIVSVVDLYGVYYLVGVNQSDSTESLTLTRVDSASKEYTYLGSYETSIFSDNGYKVGFCPFTRDTGEAYMMVAYPDASNGNQINTFYLDLDTFSEASETQVLSQTTTARPAMYQHYMGDILMAYTGSDQKMFTLEYDITTNAWGESTDITPNDANARPDIGPVLTGGPNGLYVIYFNTDGQLQYVQEKITYYAPPTGEE